jgi:alanine dehydrogenase
VEVDLAERPNRAHGAAEKVARELVTEVKIPIQATDAKTAVSGGDVIVTATNSTEPIVMSEWVRPGTHLSCMGADLHPKIECEWSLIPRCRVFADSPSQAIERGEVSQAVERGLVGKDVYAGSLGQVVNRTVPGRQSAEQITMFDAIGIGVQDTTICATILEQARAKNLGTKIQFE